VLGKHTLKPGEKTELKATFATKNLPGPFEKIITIETDIPGQQQIELFMTGTVKEAPGPKIAATPRKIDLGVLKPGEKKKQILTVTNPGALPLTITAVGTKKGASVDVSAGSLPLTIAAGQKADVELVVSTEKQGAFNERIMIESNAKDAPKTGYIIFVNGKTE
jgi:hypothetical protein